MSNRSLEFSIPLRATPEVLWKALTDAGEITRWWAPHAKVEPGQGGSIWASWGEGVEGTLPIDIWEPNRHLRLRWNSQVVDFWIESKGARTVLRLVHSGFGAGASFDDEYESTRGGWTTFLLMLEHALERHPGATAQNVTISRKTSLTAAEAWKRIAASGELDRGIAVSGHPPGYGGFEMPAMYDSYLAIFCEGKERALVTVTWVLYGLTLGEAEEIRAHWTALIERILPPRVAAPVN